MPETVTPSEEKSALLEAPRAPGGPFYDDPEHDAGDILDSLFGGPKGREEDPEDNDFEDEEGEEGDPHTDLTPSTNRREAPAKPQKPAQATGEETERWTRMESALAQLQAQNEALTQALLQRDIEQNAPEQAPEEPEQVLAEPAIPDEETMRLFQMGDPEATKTFLTWVQDVASYQAAQRLDASLPKRVEKTLNTLSQSQGELQTRVETWWEKNNNRITSIKEGVPFAKAVATLEKSGRLSHRYIEAQLDRVLQHVEEQAALYGTGGTSPTNGTQQKPKPTGPVAKGFRPTTGGASRRASAGAAESEREAANSVDALLGNKPLTSFHM